MDRKTQQQDEMDQENRDLQSAKPVQLPAESGQENIEGEEIESESDELPA